METTYNNNLNRPTIGIRPWLMWGLGALFYCYEFFLQVSPSVMVPDLMRSFSVSAAALGNLVALYFYAYAGMQIPVGILLDRFGARRLLSLAALCCGIGALLFGTSHQFVLAGIGRFIIGLGSAFAAVGCLHLAATWLPLRRFALLTGVMLTMGTLGAVGGQAPLSLLVDYFGWRNTLILFGALGATLAIIIFTIVRDRPFKTASENNATKGRLSFLSGLLTVIRYRQSWAVAIYGGLMFAPTSAFGALWGVPFLMSAYPSISRPIAAMLVSMIFIGWACGSPLFGWFSDFIQRRKVPMLAGSIGAFITMSLVIYVNHLAIILTGVLLFFFGFFSSGFLPAFSIIREINPLHYNATSLGFMNTLNMIGGAALQPLVGFILDLNWQGQMEHGARSFSLSNYHIALLALPAILAISLSILPFIKETHCQQIRE